MSTAAAAAAGFSAWAQNQGSAQTPLAQLSLAEAAARIRAGTATSTQLTQACLDRVAAYNPKLNAFITVLREQASAQARQLDSEQRAGKLRGPLHGIPIALKDNIDTAGIRTTAASAVFDDRVPTEDAEVARRLKAAGAVLLGKLNLHEFAMGGTNATSYFGPVRNPWALGLNPGGSSGGSAAAVSAELCYAALGTDTGGSIRTPSSYCGIVGFKPTYGLVSIRGIVPLTYSLDHCGPMTRTVEDAAILLTAMAGYDRLDIASVERPSPEDYAATMKLHSARQMRIGIPRAPFFDMLDEGVEKAVEDAIALIGKMTANAREVSLPSTQGISLNGESYAYHEEFYTKSAARYQIPTRRSLQNGGAARASDYVKSNWKLQMLRRTIDDSFKDVDLVVLPTRRRNPRPIDAARQREESDKMRNPELENPGPFNFFGIPAISIPCGFSNGLPVGLMIAGPRFAEGKVLALAAAYERATEWHKRRPTLRPDTPLPALRATEE